MELLLLQFAGFRLNYILFYESHKHLIEKVFNVIYKLITITTNIVYMRSLVKLSNCMVIYSYSYQISREILMNNCFFSLI